MIDAEMDDLVLEAERIPLPTDYFYGLDADAILPRNLVMFLRPALRPVDRKGAAHQRYMLIMNLRTESTVFINEKAIYLREGHALLVLPFQTHYYAFPQKPLRWLFLTFEARSERYRGMADMPIPLIAQAIGIIGGLVRAYCAGQKPDAILWAGLLLAQLERQISVDCRSPLITDQHQLMVGRINSYIHEHLATPFGIRQLAGDLGVSFSHVRSLFRKIMGISLGQYIRQVRIDRAAYLLHRSPLTVAEIAYQCGFSSPAVFCRAFCRAMGQTPTGYRKKEQ